MTMHVTQLPLSTLRDMAINMGVTDPRDVMVTRKDLESLYTVALKNQQAARQIAARINSKIAGPLTGGLPDILTPTPAPAPAPRQPEGDVLSALRRDVVALVDKSRGDTIREVNTLLESAGGRVGARLEKYDAELKQTLQAQGEAFTMRLEHDMEKAQNALKQSIEQAVIDAVRSNTPLHLQYTPAPDAPKMDLGLVHHKTPQILQALQAGVNVYLHGPAGSGKTTVAQKCASALGVPFRFAAKVESEYLLIGFKDARGETVRTQFREAYEHGGVFLFDEIDASSPSAVVAMNAALANGVCPFPDGTIARHKDFYCIAAGNTKLTGANRQYSGRAQLDAASVDRFAFIEFGYDEQLERAIASNAQWVAHVQALRAAVASRALPHLITPRATLDGCKLLAAGFDWAEVEMMVCFKGLEADTIEALRNQVKVN